ncbi:GAF and ANTAR domain-containing protein [Mycolicibacterium arseniciresistens]|uniref:GAF and ANTAR domain-containing protein n=1 Tax=Mycolicibacterium arseniciresistens TaxID=3062257 RepID=A0ABT8U9Z2_9MYCO|nr:GAF and ANTAR domain-containing protein [Mycolicibacterium arseniciresistens]MDO3634611.1 GAF and ANTAR domain-containing protein [Mycolicibacterium arseniciresistens]
MHDYECQPGRAVPPEPELSRAELDEHEADLYAGLSGVAGIVAGAKPVNELMQEVAEFAVQAIPGMQGAGLTVVDNVGDTPRIESWAVTADFVREIDSVQYETTGEGPCITSMRSRCPVVSGSLGCDPRWPHFGGRVARMGVHSALSLPLIVGDEVIGAINGYAFERDAFAEHAVTLGAQFAGPAAVSVYNARLLARAQKRTDQLRRALESRAVIDQAIGILRSRTGGTAEEAFDRLIRISQTENAKLRDVADRMVEEAVRRARARIRG